MGDLQKVLDRGEYIPLKSAPVFESKFVQVNRRGGSIYLHNRPNYVTMGICASSTKLSLPNVMLLAQSTPYSSKEDISISQSSTKRSRSRDELVLTRFIPLKFVELSVHSAKKRRIKLKLVNGRAYYLELCAPPKKQSDIFSQWVQLIGLLKSKSRASSVNTLYKEFETQEENRAITNKTGIQGLTTLEPLIDQQSSQESTDITKKASSKHVTYSDIVASFEEYQNKKSRATASSDSHLKKPPLDLAKQNKHSPELMRTAVRKEKSRERESTPKRLQTSGILKNITQSKQRYYK